MNKDAYYFPHDSNASKDPKMLGLRLKCDLAGIAIFWMLIEILRDAPDYKYIYDLPTLELGLSLPQATLQATLQACFELGLLVENGGFFSSPSLDRRMGEIDRRRDVLRDAGRRGGIKSSQAQARLKPGSSHPQAVKESKVKESKGEDGTDKTRPKDASEVTDYAKSIGFQLDGQYFLDYQGARGWRLKGGIPIKDWRRVVATWKKNNFAKTEKEAPHWSEIQLPILKK